jgi:hypothetical protein
MSNRPETVAPIERNDLTGHGTCVASKAVGGEYGAAKLAKLVVVKMVPIRSETVTSVDIIQALAITSTDVRDNGLQGKAVVNLSHGFPRPPLTTGTVTCPQGPELAPSNMVAP